MSDSSDDMAGQQQPQQPQEQGQLPLPQVQQQATLPANPTEPATTTAQLGQPGQPLPQAHAPQQHRHDFDPLPAQAQAHELQALQARLQAQRQQADNFNHIAFLRNAALAHPPRVVRNTHDDLDAAAEGVQQQQQQQQQQQEVGPPHGHAAVMFPDPFQAVGAVAHGVQQQPQPPHLLAPGGFPGPFAVPAPLAAPGPAAHGMQQQQPGPLPPAEARMRGPLRFPFERNPYPAAQQLGALAQHLHNNPNANANPIPAAGQQAPPPQLDPLQGLGAGLAQLLPHVVHPGARRGAAGEPPGAPNAPRAVWRLVASTTTFTPNQAQAQGQAAPLNGGGGGAEVVPAAAVPPSAGQGVPTAAPPTPGAGGGLAAPVPAAVGGAVPAGGGAPLPAAAAAAGNITITNHYNKSYFYNMADCGLEGDDGPPMPTVMQGGTDTSATSQDSQLPIPTLNEARRRLGDVYRLLYTIARVKDKAKQDGGSFIKAAPGGDGADWSEGNIVNLEILLKRFEKGESVLDGLVKEMAGRALKELKEVKEAAEGEGGGEVDSASANNGGGGDGMTGGGGGGGT